MLEDVKRALRSVVMITVTPFDGAGQVDGPGYRSVLRRTLDAGIDVVTPNGNTSFTIGPLKPGRYSFMGEYHAQTAQGEVLAVPAAAAH